MSAPFRIMLSIAPDHPAGAGHFPGNPIIPGAWLLAEAVRLLATQCDMDAASCTVKSAKFSLPVRPGDTLALECETVAQELRFRALTEDGRIAFSGALRLAREGRNER